MPTSIEKYEILEEIGRGGMATVYQAHDQRLERMVALKVMHPHLQGAREARARFAREARTVARLRHPGLLEIFDYSGENSDVSFIATELLNGPTLRRFVELYPEIPAELSACMALQVAEALSAAHKAGVVHRDVKPENIMFHEGRLKLTDFGIAQLMDAQGMTTTGQVLGSPGHMAPEQVEGKDCTARSDIFALGTVLYLLATGELPFSGRNPHQVLKQIVEGTFRDPLLVRPAVGSKLQQILLRCLAVDPGQRYESAESLAMDLRAFLREMNVEAPDALLREYVSAPATFVGPWTARVVERLGDLGEIAARDDRYPDALGYWNRALSLDDGNPRVLAAVQGLSQRRRRKRNLRIALSSLVSLAVLGAVVALWPRGEEAGPTLLPPAERSALAGQEAVAVAAPGSGGMSEASPAADAAVDAAVDAGPNSSDPSLRPPAAGRPQRPAGQGDRVDPKGPRLVLFQPSPANVSISVDNGAARAYGPSFRSIELTPGPHTFTFAGAHDCCVDETFRVVVPPGEGPFPLARKLAFRPAGLYVVTDAPANVLVDGRIRGRTRSILQVPHSEGLLESHDLVITAPGFERHESQVQLQAGEVRTVEVSLTGR